MSEPKTPCIDCRVEKLVGQVKDRIMAMNRHVRLLYGDELARAAIDTTLKQIRLHAGSGPHGAAITKLGR